MLLKSQGKQDVQAANEEWPEIVGGRVGERRTMKIATHQAPVQKQISVKNMSAEDLTKMKKNDPFLYYSIPGVRSARMLGKEIDVSDLGTCRMPRSSMSCPSRLQAAQGGAKNNQTVIRSKRMSFEIHPDVLLFEELGILDDLEEDDEESLGGDL